LRVEILNLNVKPEIQYDSQVKEGKPNHLDPVVADNKCTQQQVTFYDAGVKEFRSDANMPSMVASFRLKPAWN
jgi:hypothetical protein